MKHSNLYECESCRFKLRQAHVEIVNWFYEIKKVFSDCHISWTYRDEYYQNLMVQQGKSRALYPTSAHNFTVKGLPYSRAMDLFQLRSDGLASFLHSYYFDINELLSKLNAPITWGGSWSGNLGDYDHFQLNKDVV